jgi:hypothetical protein
LVPATAGLAEYQVRFRPLLLDLSHLDDGQIQGEPLLRSTLRLLKYSRGKQLADKLGEILWLIATSLPEGLLGHWIQAIEVYVMSVNKNIDQQQYKQTLAGIFPTQFEPGSLADRLLAQGREEGLEQGREQGLEQGELIGKIQVLEELLGVSSTSKSELIASSKETLLSKLVELQHRLRDRPV